MTFRDEYKNFYSFFEVFCLEMKKIGTHHSTHAQHAAPAAVSTHNPQRIGYPAQHPRFFTFITSQDMLAAYRKNPSGVALTEVIESFDVWCTEHGGSEGKLVRPSHDQLKEVFGTHDIGAVLGRILTEGNVVGGKQHLTDKSDSVFKNQMGNKGVHQ